MNIEQDCNVAARGIFGRVGTALRPSKKKFMKFMSKWEHRMDMATLYGILYRGAGRFPEVGRR
jgi:hypothetical protein